VQRPVAVQPQFRPPTAAPPLRFSPFFDRPNFHPAARVHIARGLFRSGVFA
jgi:hypothetical protein